MNNIPREKLQYIVAQYGRSICNDPKRCEALLRDLCPQYKREINVLNAALKERVPEEILKASNALPAELLFIRLIKRLHDNWGFEEDLCYWAVESWALALGFISQPGAVKIQLTKPVQTSGQQTPNALTSKPKYQLRSKPQTLSDEDIQIMIKKYNFFCKRYDWSEKWYNESGRFKNDYEDNGNGTVTDHATGLMWQKFGSKDYMSHDNAEKYINGLNRQRVAGYDNWRLPTVEELMSLLENKEMNGDFYISPLFDKKQRWCWSSDRCGSGGWWGVLFTHGRIDWYVSDLYYVRGVRH